MSELKVHARECDSEQMVQSSEIRTAFTARLRKALADKGFPEWGIGARLAKVTGKTPKAASKWLNAEAMPGRSTMIQIAEWLEVDVDWLEYGPASSPAGPRYQVEIKEADHASVYSSAHTSAISKLKQAWASMDDQEKDKAASDFLGAGKNQREIMELFFEINDASRSGALTREEVGAIGTLVRKKLK